MLTYADEHVEIVLIGNKNDKTVEREVLVEEGIDYSRKRNTAFYETSALDNKNMQIETVFQELCQRVMLNSNLHSKIGSTFNQTRQGKNRSAHSQREITLELTSNSQQQALKKGFLKKNCCSS